MNEGLVTELIADVIARSPERIAVVCGNERMTYRELDERATALAHHLIARHAELVCVAVEPSPWAPIAMLASLRAGAAYVPLDPAYPTARLADMLAQVGTPLVLATKTSAARLPPVAGTVIELDREWPAIAAAPPVPLPRLLPDSLAYVIFTSGSTGRPKGVMLPHRGLANLVHAQIDTFAIDANSVVLQFAPLSFDASVSEVFTALVAGATLCMAPRDELAPGPHLVELARKHAVTVVTLPPSSLSLLDPADFPTLQTVVSAGEACSAAIVEKWAPGHRFVNAYGPTEVTVCATMNICKPSALAPGIGAALANATVSLLDDQLRVVAPGELGEIFVGGVGVARGYLGRPDLTAERFVPDPAVPGGRRYRTGDLARYRDDGELEFAGRIDHQVKVRGHRIELGEVESVLRTAPGVRDALVLVREDRPGDVRIVAYVIANPDLDRGGVRAAAAARLPTFARPTDLVVLADWPRTPAGKIDRAKLPAPARSGSSITARSELELRMIEIWEQVLGVSDIGPDDDFFELGGHSLLAIRMLARLRAELGLDLLLSTVATQRTVAGLARVVVSRGRRPTLQSPIRLRADGARVPLFLVPPISGSALVYLPLMRRLSPTQRAIHAFHAAGLDGRHTTPNSFEALAAQYVRELVAVHPRGPLVLGGWSMGGALALEMALQLAEVGREVPHLLLIEASAPTPFLDDAIKEKIGELDIERMTYLFVNNFGRCFGVDLGLERSRFAGLEGDARVSAALSELRRVPAFPPDMDTAQLAAHLAVFIATGWGFRRWHPGKPYRGRVTHYLSLEGHPEFGQEVGRYDYSTWVEQPIELVQVPGNHFSLVNEPHVAGLAAALDHALAAID